MFSFEIISHSLSDIFSISKFSFLVYVLLKVLCFIFSNLLSKLVAPINKFNFLLTIFNEVVTSSLLTFIPFNSLQFRNKAMALDVLKSSIKSSTSCFSPKSYALGKKSSGQTFI